MSKKLNHTKHEEILKKKVKEKEEELKKEKEKRKTLEEKLKKEVNQFKKEFADRTLKLLTSGFGLVSALAWNELVREIINEFVKPLFGERSGLITLAIYAVSVTFLAVFVTYNLSKIAGAKES